MADVSSDTGLVPPLPSTLTLNMCGSSTSVSPSGPTTFLCTMMVAGCWRFVTVTMAVSFEPTVTVESGENPTRSCVEGASSVSEYMPGRRLSNVVVVPSMNGCEPTPSKVTVNGVVSLAGPKSRFSTSLTSSIFPRFWKFTSGTVVVAPGTTVTSS